MLGGSPPPVQAACPGAQAQSVDVEPEEDEADELDAVEPDDDDEEEDVLSPLDLVVLDEVEELDGAPLAEELEERESVMYQPLPLKTMPTGWMTLRSAPPHCSQVVRGGSEKLWRSTGRWREHR
jgi:hypothetical protein